MRLDFNSYQRAAYTTAIYPDSTKVNYPSLLLASEAGEVAGKVQKYMRQGKDLTNLSADERDAIVLECGDCLWAVAVLLGDLGFSMETAAQRNLDKLKSRAERGVIEGSGDNR